MGSPLVKGFMQRTLYDEIIPTLTLPRDELLSFAQAVTGRFENPYIKHALLSICLNLPVRKIRGSHKGNRSCSVCHFTNFIASR